MSEPLLAVEHLTMRFGGLVAVDDLSFAAHDREITAIIGPNGAGKTTVFNCLTGFYGRVNDHTENHIRGPRAYRGAVRRVHVGPDGPGLGGF